MASSQVNLITSSLTLLNAQAQTLSSSIVSNVSTALVPVASTTGNISASVKATIAGEVSAAGGIFDDLIDEIRRWIRDRIRELEDTVGGWIGSIVSRIAEFIGSIINTVSGWISQIVNRVKEAIESVAKSIRDAVTGLVDKIREVISNLVAGISNIVNTIRAALTNLVNQIGSVISNLVETLRIGLENLVRSIRDLVSQIANTIAQAVGDAVRRVGEFIGNVVNAVRDGLANLVQGVLDFAGQVVNGIKQGIASVVGTVIQFGRNVVESVGRFIAQAFESLRATGERVIVGIRDFIANLIVRILTFIQDVVARASKAAQDLLGIVNEAVAKPFFEFTRALQVSIASKALVAAQALRGGYGDAGELLSALFSPVEGIPPAANVSGWMLSAAFAAGTTPFIAGDAFEALRQNLRASLSVNKVDPNTAVVAAIKGGISRDFAAGIGSAYGLGGSQMGVLYEAARQVITVGQVLEATNRGLVSESDGIGHLTQQGYNQRDASVLLSLRHQIPPVQDLIRFMVRDAFNEQIVDRYGYDEDFPEAVLQWTRKQGLSDEFTRAYWRAHWELPSPSQGFEMLHRGIIDMPDLLTLLKIEDYPPFWRDKLAAISYNPITRVDIRRMYRTGVLDRDEVKQRYQMIGYTPEDAELLAEFTVKYEHTELETTLDRLETRNEKAVETAYSRGRINRDTAKQLLIRLRYTEDVAEQILALVDFEREVTLSPEVEPEFRQLSASAIRDAYSDRAISLDTAKNHLMSIGYAEADVDFLLALEDFQRNRRLLQQRASIAVDRYVEGLVDEAQVVTHLGALFLAPDEISTIMEDAELRKARKVKRLTEATLARLLRMGIISELRYHDELVSMGYSEEHASWLLTSRIVPS